MDNFVGGSGGLSCINEKFTSGNTAILSSGQITYSSNGGSSTLTYSVTSPTPVYCAFVSGAVCIGPNSSAGESIYYAYYQDAVSGSWVQVGLDSTRYYWKVDKTITGFKIVEQVWSTSTMHYTSVPKICIMGY